MLTKTEIEERLARVAGTMAADNHLGIVRTGDYRAALETAQRLAGWLVHADDFGGVAPTECDICEDIVKWLEVDNPDST